jgi:hypothetical protein
MTPDQYTFSGDAVTFLGLIGITSALLIVVTAFQRFFNSPYNIRVIPKVTQELELETETPASEIND